MCADLSLLSSLVQGLHTMFPVLLGMLVYTGSAFGVQKLITSGLIGPNGLPAHILQHTIGVGLFAYGTILVWQMRWPGIQTAAFIVEMCVLWMKLHSYLEKNRALALARDRPPAPPSSSAVDTAAAPADGAGDDGKSNGNGNGNSNGDGAGNGDDTAPVSPAVVSTIEYPANVTLSNYVLYMLMPTLVYEVEYPRTPSIRWGYVGEKMAALIGCLVTIYVVISSFISPVLNTVHTLDMIHAISKLMVPMTTVYLLIFYVIFEVVCNAFAELTRYVVNQSVVRAPARVNALIAVLCCAL
jgi:sterol O-acyltransferase